VAPYVVDARLCISYLTIEYKGLIDPKLRPLMGNRIYGCDDCQMVCPWNSHAAGSERALDDPLKPRGGNHLPDLVSLLRLDDMRFRQRFRKSPVKRTGRAAILRNVCIAMGNSGKAAFIPELIRGLDDEEGLIRVHAAWALTQLADADNQACILSALITAKKAESDNVIREEIDINIQYIRGKYGNSQGVYF
jgi:epoxyqueuosine reductase